MRCTLSVPDVTLPILVGFSLLIAAPAFARDEIHIAGSSTVFPFASAIAEHFAETTGHKTPVVEAIGTGAGLDRFCQGAGGDTIDIATASRKIEPSELEKCAKNGVLAADIAEVPLGFDGIVLAHAKGHAIALTRAEVWKALARQVPAGPKGELVANPYTTWADINPSLPATKIVVLGPPSTSGTRDAFNELLMDKGCKAAYPEVASLAADAAKKLCRAFREDGVYVEAGENDNVIVQRLEAEAGMIGIFGYSYLEENKDKLEGAAVDGVVPDYASISDGSYPLSRLLYLYVKKAHLPSVDGLAAYVTEATDEMTFGPDDGYLLSKGLIAMPEKARVAARATAASLSVK